MKLVRLDSIFKINLGHCLIASNEKEDLNGVPLISTTSKNNGITKYIQIKKDIKLAPANSITVALKGSVLSTFLQPYPFYTSIQCAYLESLSSLSLKEKFFYIKCINHNKFKYNYGRQADSTLASIMIPSLDSIPDWVSSTVLPDFSNCKNLKVNKPQIDFSTVNWGSFKILDYFKPFGGKLLTKLWCENNPGNINFITSTTTNNGVNIKIDAKALLKKEVTILKNVISVSTNGQSCWAFYQDKLCVIGLDAVGLIPLNKLSKLQCLFICHMIRKEAFRFNYGRKLNTERLEKLTIGLPQTEEGLPDWDLIQTIMERTNWTYNL